jgi:4-hydroxybenzoate polyprenyltransferase
MKFLVSTLKLMRPVQWIKNGFVFMPLVFSGRLYYLEDACRVIEMAIAFCLASSATYILNDYLDMEQDRVHPLKKHRPLASGDLSPWTALIAMCLLVVSAFALGIAAQAGAYGMGFLGAYLVLQVFYSLKLKHILLIDVLTISTGFLFRVLAGAMVISVMVSSWLFLCTFSVSILLALGKRRHEALLLNGDAVSHRPVMENYSVLLLDQLLQVVTTSTFIFYCLYSVQDHSSSGIHSEMMMFTIPMVTYGIFRYMYLIYHKKDGGSPTNLLLTDPPLLSCTIVWLVTCITIIYFFPANPV